MPIFEQGYRRYDGPVRRGPRALAIAWESIRPRMRWWVWLMTAAFAFFPYVIFAGALYFLLAQSATSSDEVIDRLVSSAPAQEVAFETRVNPRPELLGRIIYGRSGALFWQLLQWSFAIGFPVYLVAVSSAGLLASDRRTSALQIYFARPVSRLDYFAGKVLAASFFGLLLTAVPTLLVWLECALLTSQQGYVADTWWFPLGILAASSVYVLWGASLVLFFSALLPRPGIAGIASILTFIFLSALGGILGKATGDKTWSLVAPGFAAGGVTAPFLGMALPDWAPWHLCAAIGLGVPFLCLLFVHLRVRAVEVVT